MRERISSPDAPNAAPCICISQKAKGLYHCFYAGCDFNGILTDYCKDNRPMFPYKKGDSPSNTGTYRPQDSRNAENSVNEVPMLPGDYKALAPTVMQKIQAAGRIARLYGLRPVGRTPLPGRPGHLPHHRHCGTHRLSAPLLHHQKQ